MAKYQCIKTCFISSQKMYCDAGKVYDIPDLPGYAKKYFVSLEVPKPKKPSSKKKEKEEKEEEES